MKELETLKVVIDAVIRPYKEKMNAIKKETSDAMKQVDASTQKGSKSMQNLNGPAKKVIDSIRSMNAEIRKMSNDASVEAGIKKYSDSYLNLQQAIKDTERQIDILNINRPLCLTLSASNLLRITLRHRISTNPH